jgi:hypothetical protein
MLEYECSASGKPVAGTPPSALSCPNCGRAVQTVQDINGAWVLDIHSMMAATEGRPGGSEILCRTLDDGAAVHAANINVDRHVGTGQRNSPRRAYPSGGPRSTSSFSRTPSMKVSVTSPRTMLVTSVVW